MLVVMGIDPGVANTGFGIVRLAGSQMSAIDGGQTRGVAMLAAAERGIRCFDYTPQAVKMAVCGAGSAAKEQVQRMVGSLLGLSEPPQSDHAADALAVAICHASHAPRRRGRIAPPVPPAPLDGA